MKIYRSEREMLAEMMGTLVTSHAPRQVDPAGGKAAAIYHEMRTGDSFDQTAEILFNLVRETIRKYPDKRRVLYLDIDRPRNPADGFDPDAYEIQNGYVCGFLGQWLHAAHMPLVCWTNDEASNDIAQSLKVR